MCAKLCFIVGNINFVYVCMNNNCSSLADLVLFSSVQCTPSFYIEVTDVMLYYGNVGQRSGLRVNVTLNIVLPLQYRLETARRVGAFATRRLGAEIS